MSDTLQKYGHYRHLLARYTDDSRAFENDYRDLIIAEKNARSVLPYSQRSNPNLTLHDAEHSYRVIKLINEIIDVILDNGNSLSDEEIKILYYSAWYHDLGIVLSDNEYDGKPHKFDHAQLSAEILRKHSDEYFLFESESKEAFVDAVCRVIISHKHGTEDVSEEITIGSNPVRLRLISAILCLADLCDISNRRAPTIVYQLLTDELNAKPLNAEEVRHWKANINTKIGLDSRKQLIFVEYSD